MMKNNIASSEKTVGTGIGGEMGVGTIIDCSSPIFIVSVIAPTVVPIIIAAGGVVGAVGRWLGRDSFGLKPIAFAGR
ncbi:hypothetical protein [Selenomonas ruminantium]|uniref:Uncharacterized protein n=1 Tax=Selenomonas ruminantium TaxID=971 RepID=A0A1H0NJ52_SELRU|nr:hypothetical protein [Selenomonas ruminantium]SDO92782.1 hypothetical protein SAMN05216366_103101 [Selenomonas ruminantium]